MLLWLARGLGMGQLLRGSDSRAAPGSVAAASCSQLGCGEQGAGEWSGWRCPQQDPAQGCCCCCWGRGCCFARSGAAGRGSEGVRECGMSCSLPFEGAGRASELPLRLRGSGS